VDHLIHAGDVGRDGLLAELETIAPVTAVRGNVDRGPWAEALPTTAEIELGGAWFHVLHVVDDLDLDPRGAGFDVVVFGHSHAPAIERRGGVLFVNPGSVGPRRFDLPVALAFAEIEDGRIDLKQIRLDETVQPGRGRR
jgi:putative phosphoesterase